MFLLTLTGSIDVVGHARIERAKELGCSLFLSKGGGMQVKSFLKKASDLGWCLMFFFFCFLVNFRNTPAKTKECPSKKGHFEKEKLVFQPLFFRVDILVFAGE